MTRLRIASVNVNGIRAAVRNGMHDWLETADVDVLTLQEVRAPRAELEKALPGWIIVDEEATAKGRAGVAIASRSEAAAVRIGIAAAEHDTAGRWIESDFVVNGRTVTVVSAYVFTGEAETPAKQDPKWAMLDAMTLRLPELSADDALALITGDLNVGHRELDIKNWKGNVKKSGFLPRERAYFDRFLGASGAEITGVDGSVGAGLGWIDVGRTHAGEVPGPYTWWSARGKAFDNDSGWRIDYHLASPALAAVASNYSVFRAPSYDTRWSDHAPVIVDYEI
ncbi:MAG: endonuclease/exonuclease/phosphatase family protein [Microbacterium sp.]|jgi:exodeoxyribonuclease-3|nr:endonuclease/exonuclease/phosphatase family protein [Microbacterium sp.]